jgi:electron transport complex protein RnfB
MLEAVLSEALPAVGAVGAIALAFGAVLGWAAVRLKVDEDPVVEQIDALLPQTQCGQCGHPGCKPYAEAIASGADPINLCVPGGDTTIAEIADLLGVEPEPLDGEATEPMVAFIREDECIGCTKCIQACPVDAILGAAKYMHTVIADECTGCDLCVEPCPVDCIEMRPRETGITDWSWSLPEPELIATDRRPGTVNAGREAA